MAAGANQPCCFGLPFGCSVMIKGPLLPMIIVLCFGTLLQSGSAKQAWMKPLTFWLGPLLFLAIILPWGILIWKATDGKFFTDAIGGDLGNKLKGGQETHGGLHLDIIPGTIWLGFWPACLFLVARALPLPCGLGTAKMVLTAPVARKPRRLLLVLEQYHFLSVLEVIPTKLPHYPLPIYPGIGA